MPRFVSIAPIRIANTLASKHGHTQAGGGMNSLDETTRRRDGYMDSEASGQLGDRHIGAETDSVPIDTGF